ncbi:MAG: hypothetical protein ABWZ15_17075, partial [Acidimicrobiia bacterium]
TPPPDRPRDHPAWPAGGPPPRPLDVEYRAVQPGGAVRHVYVRAEPAISSAGAVVGLRGIGQDITDRVSRD